MIVAMRLLVRLAALALAVVLLTASPVAADPAGPSDFRSEVTGVSPDDGAVVAEIRGGDAFLELDVAARHTVIVQGYEGEPYLRFQPDGTVQRNRLSTATYLNDDRRGSGVTIPADAREADADTPPDWQEVADGGTYAWHDHRVHWMEEASPGVARGEQVGGAYDPWRVPLVIDGAPGEVQGILIYEDTVSPLPYAGLAVVVAGAVAWYLRKTSLRLPAVLLAVISALAVVVGTADYRSTPDGGGNPLLWALAAFALLAAIGAGVLARRSAGVVLLLASVASLSGWALFRIQALLKPVLPTDLPFALDRTTIALALGISAASAYLAATSGALKLPDLEEDEVRANPPA